MTNWLLKFLTKQYNLISKDRIQQFLDNARKNERESVIKKYEEILENERTRLIDDFNFTMQEKDAEISRLIREVENLKEGLKQSEIVYFKSTHRAKTNFRIANDMKFYAKKYMDDAIRSFQSVQALFENAQEHQKQITQEEEIDKKQLGIK